MSILPDNENCVALEQGREVLPAAPFASRLRSLLMFSLAVGIALVVHLLISTKEPPAETHLYTIFLCSVLAIAVLTSPAQLFSSGVQRWRQNVHPILIAGISLLCTWEIITTGLRLMPLP